jgi:hypothetical protein
MGWRAHISADESGVRARLVYTTWAVLVELAGSLPETADKTKPAQPLGCAG